MFKVISHTADVGIDVSAESVEDLLIEAARGWKYSVIEDSPTAAREEREIQLNAASLEDLMVQWLNELNYYLTVREWILHDVIQCGIKSEESGWTASFLISGEQLDYDKHEIFIEIKSVTYHQLEIRKENNQFKTRIIFDI